MLTYLPVPSPSEWMARPRTNMPPSPPEFPPRSKTVRSHGTPAPTRTAFRDVANATATALPRTAFCDVANTTATISDISHAQRSIRFTDKAKATDSTAPRSHKLTPRRRSQRASMQQHDVRLAATLGSAGLGQRDAKRPQPSHDGRPLWLSRPMPSPVRRSPARSASLFR
ncbi:hypothetical protein BKA62DRAFT_696432 [Auriculariales sp. MPI-PUGE-AT-0066]|nr:hypothetical protein BKA62DRAFT_696432 [Auriculariales sp. MPI-PUGE-AT-0066]